jgi:hypothetical protein
LYLLMLEMRPFSHNEKSRKIDRIVATG